MPTHILDADAQDQECIYKYADDGIHWLKFLSNSSQSVANMCE